MILMDGDIILNLDGLRMANKYDSDSGKYEIQLYYEDGHHYTISFTDSETRNGFFDKLKSKQQSADK